MQIFYMQGKLDLGGSIAAVGRQTHYFILAVLLLLVTQQVLGHIPSEALWTFGDPGDNWRTEFVGGDGAGSCSIQGMPNYWVNTATRGLVVQDTDYRYDGLGPLVRFTRTYNAPRHNGLKEPSGVFGVNWIFSYESTIDYSGQSVLWEDPYVVLTRGSGQGLKYLIDLSAEPPVAAAPLPGYYDRLTWYGDYWLYWEKATGLTYRYDKVTDAELSRLVAIADTDGNTVTVSYNSDGTIHSITDAAERTTILSYNSQEYCTALALPDGREVTFEYDTEGNMVRSIDLQGAVSTFFYDQDHFMTALNAAGRMTTFEKEFGGQVKRLIDARGNEWKFASDWGADLVIDPNGVEWSYSSGSDGWTNGKSNSLGRAFVRSYSGGNLTDSYITDWGSADHKSFTYDERGNLTQIRYRSGRDADFSWIYINYTYDENDNLLSVQDPLGNTWQFSYDQERHLTMMRSPMGFETQLAYTDRGQLSKMTDALGNNTYYSYDAFGNLTSVSDAIGTIATFGYDASGLRNVSSGDALGYVTQYSYDSNDRLTSVRYPDGSTVDHSYDCCAGTSTTDENGETSSLVRDPLLKPIQYIDNAGNHWAFAYDGNNNLATLTDSLGHTVRSYFDELNRMVRLQDALGESVEFEYDTASNLISLTNQKGKKTSFTYFRNLLKSVSDPSGNKIQYQHDLLDRVEQLTNARGQNVQVEYDADGRLIRRSFPGSQATEYKYDAVGNLTSISNESGTTSYEYNSRYDVTKVTNPDGKQISMTYNAAGDLSSLVYPGGFEVNYAYDSRHRITQASWSGGQVDLVYDSAGNLLTVTRSNKTVSRFNYDKNGRFSSLSHETNGDIWADFSFVRDVAGRAIMEMNSSLLSVIQEPGQAEATFNEANQLTQFGQESVEYDADGNLIGAGAGFSAIYDSLNRPTSITRNGVATNYSYDGLGNRVSVKRGIRESYFRHDAAGNLLFETDGKGGVSVRYIYAGGLLLARTIGDESTFYHFDSRGSTLALTDSTGEVVAAYSYDPFGRVVHQTGSIYNPFTFLGAYGVMDEIGGLFFAKSRYYDSTHQRFLHKDPLGISGGLNPYSYTSNSPIDYIDPSGLRGHTTRPGFFRNPRAAPHFEAWKRARHAGAEIAKNALPTKQHPYVSRAIQIGSWLAWGTDKVLGYHPVTGTPWGVVTGWVQLLRGDTKDAFLRFMGAIPGYKQYKNIGTIYSGVADFTTLATKLITSSPSPGGNGGGVCAPPHMFNPVPLYR